MRRRHVVSRSRRLVTGVSLALLALLALGARHERIAAAVEAEPGVLTVVVYKVPPGCPDASAFKQEASPTHAEVHRG